MEQAVKQPLSEEQYSFSLSEASSFLTFCKVCDIDVFEDFTICQGDTNFFDVIQDYSDINEYVVRIFRLLSDQDLYHTFSRNAIKHVRKNFSQHAAIKIWDKIFDSIYQDKNNL